MDSLPTFDPILLTDTGNTMELMTAVCQQLLINWGRIQEKTISVEVEFHQNSDHVNSRHKCLLMVSRFLDVIMLIGCGALEEKEVMFAGGVEQGVLRGVQYSPRLLD